MGKRRGTAPPRAPRGMGSAGGRPSAPVRGPVRAGPNREPLGRSREACSMDRSGLARPVRTLGRGPRGGRRFGRRRRAGGGGEDLRSAPHRGAGPLPAGLGRGHRRYGRYPELRICPSIGEPPMPKSRVRKKKVYSNPSGNSSQSGESYERSPLWVPITAVARIVIGIGLLTRYFLRSEEHTSEL